MNTYSERDELISTMSDLYKSVYGMRPRHYDWANMTDQQLDTEFDRLVVELRNVELEEQRMTDLAVVAFKQLITKTIDMGAGDELTALRWLTQDEEFYSPQDVERWLYGHRILFTQYGKEMLVKLLGQIEYSKL